MTDTTLNEIIRDHAMLVAVHISSWPASAKDNDAAKAAADASGAEGAGAFKAHKNLMFKHDARLKKVRGTGQALRVMHNELTMAWDAGKSPFRMLATVEFERYMETIGKLKGEYETALNDFCAHYLEDKTLAMRALNIENDPRAHRLYPTEDKIRDRFQIELCFEPIPAGRSFRNLPDSAVAALAHRHEARVAERYETAVADTQTILFEQLAHLREVLAVECEGDKAQRWRNSSVTSIITTATVLGNFDFSGDGALKAQCEAIATYFGRFSPPALSELRKPAAASARLNVRECCATFEGALERLQVDEGTEA